MRFFLPVLVFSLFFAFLAVKVSAYPSISNLAVNPSNPWLGEGFGVSLNCIDDISNVENVGLRIEGEGLALPETLMAKVSNSTYILNISGPSIDRRGAFSAVAICRNNNMENATKTLNFSISLLTGQITEINSNYIGDAMSAYFMLKKDGIFPPPEPSPYFWITVNNIAAPLKQTPYTAFYSAKGWRLDVDTPSSPGTYDIAVYANYSGKVISNTTQVSVENPLTFSISSIDKTWVNAGDNITIRATASYRGSAIQITNSNIRVFVGGTQMTIAQITQSGSYHDIKVAIPVMSPGSKELYLELSHLSYTSASTRQIYYTTKVSGKIEGADNKGTGVEIRFKSASADVSIPMDTNGQYSSFLPPDKYDITVSHTRSKLVLYGVDISSFDDPIKYNYISSPGVRGLSLSDLFIYEISVPFSSSYVELKYDESRVDENKISLFRCASWNAGKGVCNLNWTKVESILDTVRNLVKFNTSEFSAYGIGSEKAPTITLGADKLMYWAGEKMKLRGLVTDGSALLEGVLMNITIRGTQMHMTTRSNSTGIFEFNLAAPTAEGEYVADVCGDIPPFSVQCVTAGFTVSKFRSVSVSMQDAVRLDWGDNYVLNVTVFNKGDTELKHVRAALTGIPNGYAVQNVFELGDIPVSGSIALSIPLSIPEGSGNVVHSMRLNITADSISTEKIAALTVMERANSNKTADNDTSNPSDQITGEVIWSVSMFGWEIAYLTAFFSLSAASVFFARKRLKSREYERHQVKNALLEIKKEIYGGQAAGLKDKRTKTKKRRGLR